MSGSVAFPQTVGLTHRLLLRQLVHQTLDACHACLRHHCDVTPLIDVVHDIAAEHPEVCMYTI